jgi:hypothetical protein
MGQVDETPECVIGPCRRIHDSTSDVLSPSRAQPDLAIGRSCLSDNIYRIDKGQNRRSRCRHTPRYSRSHRRSSGRRSSSSRCRQRCRMCSRLRLYNSGRRSSRSPRNPSRRCCSRLRWYKFGRLSSRPGRIPAPWGSRLSSGRYQSGRIHRCSRRSRWLWSRCSSQGNTHCQWQCRRCSSYTRRLGRSGWGHSRPCRRSTADRDCSRRRY